MDPAHEAAIRTLNPVNLGWNGVASVLSFKHQIGLVDSDYVGSAYDAVDRGIVQVQLAGSSGAAVDTWRKIYPYENVQTRTWVQSDLSRYRARRLRVRLPATSLELGAAITWEQALSWSFGGRFEADDGWYVDDIQVTNTLTSAATVSVDQADRSGLPACGPACASITASITASPPTVGPGESVTLDASGSVADQCPGGTLLYRFWEDWQNDGFFSVGEDDAIQEWGANAIVTRDIDCKTSHEYVDVRCSTRPGWVSKTQVSWQVNLLPDVIVGDLGALRASEGQFDGTVSSCLLNSPYRFGTPVPGFTHVDTPEPGEAFYYLVK